MSRQADYSLSVRSSFAQVSEQDWNDLHAQAPDATLFQTYGWVRAWWDTSRPPGAQLCIIHARLGDLLVGLAPLYIQPGPLPTLQFLGGFHNDYQLCLLHPAHGDVYRRIQEHVLAAIPAAIFKLREVPRWSETCRQIQQETRRTVTLDPTPCPRLRFDTEADVSRFAAKASVRRKRNRLQRVGSLQVAHLTDRQDIVDGLPGLWRQHRERWGRSSAFHQSRHRQFYQQLVALLPAGSVTLTRLTLDGTAIAYHLGFSSGGDFLWYKPTYDRAYAWYSPGEVMLAAVIQHVQQAGFAALDYTRGAEAYKFRFANELRWNENFEAYPARARFAWRYAERELRLSYRALRQRWHDVRGAQRSG